MYQLNAVPGRTFAALRVEVECGESLSSDSDEIVIAKVGFNLYGRRSLVLFECWQFAVLSCVLMLQEGKVVRKCWD
ncbi:hypothetical protein DQ04_18091000 [Trypanosoma grayi]|uniref:hypothetical protein n=1 Tax=Trypanosoma grayi TaxID=71804 RepID=UPI0004F49F54|nr:hypothetical protein DQ04_18091000 [Trypanosoma grayi]KEG05827.1 hypothetical protein DQ04_18091000 [Trypanosoma grayi]